MSTKKHKLFSLSRDSFEWHYFRAGGKGGQHQNKTSSGVRCVHRASGAVGEARDTRSQAENRRLAFKRMAATKEFRGWVNLEAARRTGAIESAVEAAMHPSNLKIETF